MAANKIMLLDGPSDPYPTLEKISEALVLVLAAMALLLVPVVHLHAQDLDLAARQMSEQQFAKALVQVDGVLAERPRQPEALFLRSVALTGLGKSAEAMAVLRQLTEEFPELPEPYNNLAVLYAQQGRYDQARDVLERAIQVKPDYATAHENLGDIYARLAIEHYRKSAKLAPKNTGVERKLKITGELFAASSPK